MKPHERFSFGGRAQRPGRQAGRQHLGEFLDREPSGVATRDDDVDVAEDLGGHRGGVGGHVDHVVAGRLARLGAAATIGIDIGGTKSLYALLNENFEVVAEEKLRNHPTRGGLKSFERACRARSRHCARRRAATPSSRTTSLRLYGEHRLGAARKARHVIGVWLGTGVGGALIVNGRLIWARTALPETWAITCCTPWMPRLRKMAGTDVKDIKSAHLAEAIRRGDREVEKLVRSRAGVLGAALAADMFSGDPPIELC